MIAEKKERAFGLDILRAVAILLVIFVHMTLPFKFGTHAGFWNSIFSRGGSLGVEIFFVLSGFLIGTILIKLFNKDEKYNIKQIKGFWTRRWFRTLPNYYLVLILTMLLFYWLYGKIDFSWTYLVFLQRPDWLVVVWSLIVEEWFYLLFPLLLFGIFNIFKLFGKSNSKYNILLTSVCVIIILPVLLNLLNIFNLVDLSFAFGFMKNTISLFYGIGIGVLIGFLCYYHAKFFIRHKKIMLWIGLILFILAIIGFFTIDGSTNIIQILELINGLVLSFSISFMIPFLSQIKKPNNKLIFISITYTSLISYSLYLTHTTIIEIFYKITDFYLITNIFALYIKSFISLILVFLIAAILYHIWEKPMTSVRDKFGNQTPK